jgi:hypothetical protein
MLGRCQPDKLLQAVGLVAVAFRYSFAFVSIEPDVPAKTLAVVPDLPGSWNELSIDNLHVVSDQIAVSVKRAGINYVTTVSAPAGWRLTIGYTFPVNTQIKLVRLNNSPAAFRIVNTNRGEELKTTT